MTSNSDDDLVAALSDIIDLMFAKRRRFTKGAAAIVGRTGFLRTKEGRARSRVRLDDNLRAYIDESREVRLVSLSRPLIPRAAKAALRDPASFLSE